MKTPLFLLLAFFAAGAPLPPAAAQDETALPREDGAALTELEKPPEKPARKKPAKKKKAKKQPAREPESEYKFKAVDTPPAYKFDKLSNPILKAKPRPKTKPRAKKAKIAKKQAEKTSSRLDPSAPKLKKVPGFEDEAPADSPDGGQGGGQ